MLIHAEVFVTPDSPTVQFREPKNKVNLEEELPKILQAQGWGIGTYFNVQFISHDRTEVFSSASFMVNLENESLRTSNPEAYSPNTKVVYAREYTQLTDWVYFGSAKSTKKEIKWNPGKKQHELLQGGDVLFASKDKDEVIAELEQEAA